MMILGAIVVSQLLLSDATAHVISRLPSRLRSGTKFPRGIGTMEFLTRAEAKVVAENEAWGGALSMGSMSHTAPLFPTDCCGLLYGSREKKLFEIFSTVSDSKAIETPGTPQNRAFNWIVNDDQYCICPSNTSCELVERYVMAVFYYSTGGDNWVYCGANSTECSSSGTTYNGNPTSTCFA